MESSCQEATIPATTVKLNHSEPQRSNYFGWLQSTISQSADVWNSIKRDITEVAQSVSVSDSISAAKGTASTVYRQLTDAVQSLQQEGAKAEPPPPEPAQSLVDAAEVNEDFSTQISSIKSSFTGIVSALEKGISELTGGSFKFVLSGSGSGPSGDNREARLEVIRADPATYEQEPALQRDILPYAVWRSTYFNEDTCAPQSAIPVFEGTEVPPAAASATYPSPAEVLAAFPAVRTNLARLVDPDADAGESGGLREGDFWSRYYYRVWCLDVLEARRQRLAKLGVGKTEVTAMQKSSGEEEDGEDKAWPGLDEGDTASSENSRSSNNVQLADSFSAASLNDSQRSSPAVGHSSSASSIVMVSKEDAEAAHDANGDGDAEDEDLTQKTPATTVQAELSDEESDEEAIELSPNCLRQEEEKLRAELGPNDNNNDEYEPGSDWEKWT